MALQNVKPILQVGSLLSSFKLLLTQSLTSRPKYRSLALPLLQPFVHDGVLSIRYRCYERFYNTSMRMSDLHADYISTRELCVNDIYHLERDFDPDIVIDGGGNVGFFTLRAAAAFASSSKAPAKFVVCEPLPRNVEQIQKHLDLNGLKAEIQPYCLGGVRRTIPFYCRAANESSFEPDPSYDRVLDIPVVLLQDAIGSSAGERILIKLDIEGMEVEALEAFIPTEQRSVYIVGELHNHPQNAPLMEDLFRRHGWTLEFFDVDTMTSSFRACSPSAVPLLAWAANVRPAARPA